MLRRSRFGYGTVSRLSVCLSSGVFRNMKRGVPSVSGVGNMQRSGQRWGGLGNGSPPAGSRGRARWVSGGKYQVFNSYKYNKINHLSC